MNENFWESKNVFLTGANGFIGSWVATELVNRGANVTVVIRDIIPNSYLNLSGTSKKVTKVTGTITDYRLLERIMSE